MKAGRMECPPLFSPLDEGSVEVGPQLSGGTVPLVHISERSILVAYDSEDGLTIAELPLDSIQ